MALIKCPECGREVSDKATACPSCAYRLGAATLIEQTAKRWKTIQIFGVVVVLLGLVFVVTAIGSESSAGGVLAALFTAVGIAVYVVGRVGAWWHYG